MARAMPADKYMAERQEDKAEARMNMVCIFVRNLVLDAAIGAYEREQGRPQKVRINIQLEVSAKAVGTGDRLDNVVCYNSVVASVKKIIQHGHINLVETLAERIAATCLEDRRVLRAQVRVEKLEAITEAESVGVEIIRVNQR